MRVLLPSVALLERHPELATVIALEAILDLAERALLAVEPPKPPTTTSPVADMLLLQMQTLRHGIEVYRDVLEERGLD